jgi:hypothetical protein
LLARVALDRTACQHASDTPTHPVWRWHHEHCQRLEASIMSKRPPPPAAAKPKPKSEPAPSTPKKPLPERGAELPECPLHESDVPQGAIVQSGTLVHWRNLLTGRPFILLAVPCSYHRGGFGKHLYPWRGDWPVDISVRSRQRSRCRTRPDRAVWLGLDPERLAISRAAFARATCEFQEWQARWSAMTPEQRSAIRKANRLPGETTP